MGRLRKACQLTGGDWLFLGQVWALLLTVELRLHVQPFRAVLAWSRRQARPRQSRFTPSVDRCAWLTTVAGRYHFVRTTCLKEALALSVLLGRRGITTQLRVGVARDAESLTAHAWLEQNDQIILGLQPTQGFELLQFDGADPV